MAAKTYMRRTKNENKKDGKAFISEKTRKEKKIVYAELVVFMVCD